MHSASGSKTNPPAVQGSCAGVAPKTQTGSQSLTQVSEMFNYIKYHEYKKLLIFLRQFVTTLLKNLHANIKIIYNLIFENKSNNIYCTIEPC